MSAPTVQLMHVEFLDARDQSEGGYWLARWHCEDCGTRGELAGARVGIDGVPLRARGQALADKHRCGSSPAPLPSAGGMHLVPHAEATGSVPLGDVA